MTTKTCTRCILDTTVGDIWFDEKGECKYCIINDEMEKMHPLDSVSEERLQTIVSKIKQDGKNKQYDCIAGISGGRDSTYTILKAVQLGLRPLAVHFDNGWNSEISVKNIKKTLDKLNVPLYTVVADWEEFKDLQVSFLKASTPDADIPTDYAIYSVLFKVAAKEGVKYILNGHSFRTEGTSPISWTYMDGRYLKSVHKKYGKVKKIKSFPILSLPTLLYYTLVKGIKDTRVLEYMDYCKKDVDKILISELDWEYYGGHHHENLFTKFFQSYYLPHKFKIDKRKTELSALVRSGQIKREDALAEIDASHYQYDPAVVDYARTKLGLSEEEFNTIMETPVRSHDDYPTYLPLIKTLKWPIKMATKMKLLPHILYLKYASN